METSQYEIERHIARCRLVLSVAAPIAVYLDPAYPTLTRWLPLTGGAFAIDPYALKVMSVYAVYSLAVTLAVGRRLVEPARIALASTWIDVLFGACIALFTEGANSPFYAYFAFTVFAAGFRGGLHRALQVTAACVVIYLGLILVSNPGGTNLYTMRPAYLILFGYLVGYLGEERMTLQWKIRELEAAAQRERIARRLHDGFVQALAGVTLRVESCRELLRRGQSQEAFEELTELQAGVNREHDQLRAYIRSLIDRESNGIPAAADAGARFAVRVEFDGDLSLVEHVLQIALEGARNVGRHAQARSAAITAGADGANVRITIQDDGVGFPAGSPPPWSICSRAAELGGEVRLGRSHQAGGHVEIELPEA
jgi:signal transduction histidine kinase